MDNATARYINIAAGVWLVLSAFVWHHESAPRAISLVTGVLVVLVALFSLAAPRARYVNVGLGVWLFASVVAFPHRNLATMWNNLIVAGVITFVALAGPGVTSPRRPAGAPR